MKKNLKNTFEKKEHFGQMGISVVLSEKELVMRQYKSTSEIKDRSAHSWSKLKTCTFSEQKYIKGGIL